MLIQHSSCAPRSKTLLVLLTHASPHGYLVSHIFFFVLQNIKVSLSFHADMNVNNRWFSSVFGNKEAGICLTPQHHCVFGCINTAPNMSVAICLKKDSQVSLNEFL